MIYNYVLKSTAFDRATKNIKNCSYKAYNNAKIITLA